MQFYVLGKRKVHWEILNFRLNYEGFSCKVFAESLCLISHTKAHVNSRQISLLLLIESELTAPES